MGAANALDGGMLSLLSCEGHCQATTNSRTSNASSTPPSLGGGGDQKSHWVEAQGSVPSPTHTGRSPVDSKAQGEKRSSSGRGNGSCAAWENLGATDPREGRHCSRALHRAPDSSIRADVRRPLAFPERGAQCRGGGVAGWGHLC